MVDVLTLSIYGLGIDNLTVGATGQCSDVLFNERAQNLGVERAYKVESKVGSIGSTLLGNSKHTVVIGSSKVLGLHHTQHSVTSIHSAAKRVAEDELGIRSVVGIYALVLAFVHVVHLLVLANVGESEVNELQHSFEVFNSTVGINNFAIKVDVKTSRCFLTGERLLEVGSREVTQTTCFVKVREYLESRGISLIVESLTTLTYSVHNNLVVFEVGFLQYDFSTVRENPLGSAVERALQLGDNATCSEFFRDKGLVRNLIDIGSDFLGLYLFDSSDCLLGSGICNALFFGTCYADNDVIVGNSTGHILVDSLNGNLGSQTLHKLIFEFDAGDVTTVDVMTDVLVGILDVATSVALVELVFEVGQEVGFGAIILGSSETETTGTHSLAYHTFDTIDNFTLFDSSAERVGILCRREAEELAVVAISIQERSVGFVGNFAETVAKHNACHALDVILYGTNHSTTILTGHRIVLEVNLYACRSSLNVATYNIDRLVIIGHLVIDALSRIFGHFDTTEQLFNACFHLSSVEVTDNDDGLVVGTIPFMVVVAQVLVGEVHNDLHSTNGETVGILAALEHNGDNLLHNTPLCIVASTPFFVDNATLVVDFGFLQEDIASPIVEHPKTRVNQTGVGSGHVRDAINCFVKTCVSVDVNTKLDTVLLKVVEHIFTREFTSTVESHMLEEVSKTTLVFFFKYRTYALRDVELGTILGCFVVTDVIGQTVVKNTVTNLLVDRQRLLHRILLLCYSGHHECHNGCKQKAFQYFYVHFSLVLKGFI